MGNASKALYSKQQYLYYHLNRKQYSKIDLILAKNPGLLEAPITKDTKLTLLMRATQNANLQSVNFILQKNPNVNAITPKGQTALSIAVKKNQLEIVKKLIQKGADINHTIKDLTMLDLAILPGYYDVACYIFAKSQKSMIKQPEEYQLIAKKYSYRYVNYQQFISAIKSGGDHHAFNQQYLNKQKIKLQDPVPDPRQSWKQWLKRNVQFKEAPLVQRNSLPPELQPQNRGVKGKMDVFLTNWSRIDSRKQSTIRPKYAQREVMSQMGQLNVKGRKTETASLG